MTHDTREVEELAKELRIIANMINMGEKIQWARETTLMDEAADMLETLRQTSQEREREIVREVLEAIDTFDMEGIWAVERDIKAIAQKYNITLTNPYQP